MVLKYLRSIHSDLGIKISRIYIFNDLSLFLKFDQMYKSWNSCINSSFLSIPIEIYKDILWRGLSMEKRFENLEQIFTFKASYSEKHTFKSFKTEYGRYVSFIKNYFRKKVKNYYLKYFKFNHKGSK